MGSVLLIFATTPQNISLHVGNIYQDQELSEVGTRKKFFLVRQEGKRQVIKHRDIRLLNMIRRTDPVIPAIKVNRGIMRAFVAVRQALPILATKQDIEDLRQRVKALEEAGIATQTTIDDTKKELLQVYEALTQLGEKENEPREPIGYTAIQERRKREE